MPPYKMPRNDDERKSFFVQMATVKIAKINGAIHDLEGLASNPMCYWDAETFQDAIFNPINTKLQKCRMEFEKSPLVTTKMEKGA